MEEEKTKYISYNGLSRKALVFGVPMMTLVAFAFAIILSFVVGIATLPTKFALIAPAILCMVLFGVKMMCEDKSNAMDDIVWIIKGALLRFKHQSIVLTVSSQADSDKIKKEKINDFYKKHKCR